MTSDWMQVPVVKCLNYTKTTCKATSKPVTERLDWTDQKVVPSGSEDMQHCFNQTKVDCSKRTVTETIKKPVQKTRTVTDQQRKCRMVQNKLPDQEYTVPVTRVTYKTMCYNIPRLIITFYSDS